MKLKVDKNQALSDIKMSAEYAAKRALENNTYSSSNNSINEILTRAISMAVEEGFRRFLELQYTNEDFERDIGLKP